MLDIISVGPGEAVLLTDDAKQAIDRADAVWCAARHAVLVPPEKARPLSPLEGAIEQMRLSSDAGQSAAVLVSGDAGLYSLLEMLKRKIGGEYLRVHPGVSALQLFAARLGVSWQDAKILSAHGRALSESALCHAGWKMCGCLSANGSPIPTSGRRPMTRMRRMTRSAWLISKTTRRRAACRLLVCRMRLSFAAKPR